MWKEFKAFISRGNVLDLAIGVVIGAAFGKIVTTLVEGIIMPPIGWLTSGVDFKQKYVYLGKNPEKLADLDKAIKDGEPIIRYGQFITDVITFLIVAFVMFLLARWAVNLFKAFVPPPAPPTGEEVLLAEIRDILKDRK